MLWQPHMECHTYDKGRHGCHCSAVPPCDGLEDGSGGLVEELYGVGDVHRQDVSPHPAEHSEEAASDTLVPNLK